MKSNSAVFLLWVAGYLATKRIEAKTVLGTAVAEPRWGLLGDNGAKMGSLGDNGAEMSYITILA